jgi:hypothetical protein
MEQCEKCAGCNSHFRNLRNTVSDYVISKHLERDIENYQDIVNKIISCSTADFFELHKFEEKIGDASIFRAKMNKIHIVYAVHNEKLIFLRAFKNFKEYKKFLEDKKEIREMIKAFA